MSHEMKLENYSHVTNGTIWYKILILIYILLHLPIISPPLAKFEFNNLNPSDYRENNYQNLKNRERERKQKLTKICS